MKHPRLKMVKNSEKKCGSPTYDFLMGSNCPTHGVIFITMPGGRRVMISEGMTYINVRILDNDFNVLGKVVSDEQGTTFSPGEE